MEALVIERPRTITVTATSDAAAVAHFKRTARPGPGWAVENVRVVWRRGAQRTVAGTFRLEKS